jgi:hypothetical protein
MVSAASETSEDEPPFVFNRLPAICAQEDEDNRWLTFHAHTPTRPHGKATPLRHKQSIEQGRMFVTH